MKKIYWGLVGIIFLMVFALAFSAVFFKLRSTQAPKSESVSSLKALNRSKVSLPRGSVTYRVAQAADIMPHIVQLSVDPVDVHVGDKQTLTLIVQDSSKIVSAEAKIETDHKTLTVPLKLVGETAFSEVLPQIFSVDTHNQLVLGGPSKRGVANADLAKLKYQAVWDVVDTHDATYRTTFVVRDENGKENSDTITWTDLCNIPASGSWSLSSNAGNCTIGNAIDGVDSGNAIVDSYSLTVNPSGIFAYTSGNNITITNGTINIADGGQILKAQLYGTDNDGDGYVGAWGLSGSVLKRNAAGVRDCYDSNANAKPGQTGWFTSNRGDGSFDYNCDGVETQQLTTAGGYFGGGMACSSPPSTPYCRTITGNGGWTGGVPGCGVSGGYANTANTAYGCCGSGGCITCPTPYATTTIQSCQ